MDILFGSIGYPVWVNWLSCLGPLVILFGSIGYPVWVHWFSCLGPLVILFGSIGYPVWVHWSNGPKQANQLTQTG
jgi:general stress protein CsbA